MLKWSLQKQAAVGFIIASLILLTIGSFFYLSMNNVIQSHIERTKSFVFISSLKELLSELRDAETGQRGYILTGKENYLEPYYRAQKLIYQDTGKVLLLNREHHPQQYDLNRLQILVYQKMDELKKTIHLRKQSGFEPALQLVDTDQGKQTQDQIRILIQEVEKKENHLLADHDARLMEGLSRSILLSVLGTLSAMGLLVLVYILLNSEMIKRQKTNDQLEIEINDRKSAEAKIQDLNQSLQNQLITVEASNKELEAFAYSVSHDLRAPLRSIDGFSKLLLEKANAKLDEGEQRYLSNICKNSQRMGELIDDLLKLSRISRIEIQHETVDLSALAKDILERFQKENTNRTVEIAVMSHMAVEGDRNLLRIMLENLLGNAWKFTSQKEKARIEVGMKRENGQPIYYIRDNGAGFNMKYADKLFGVFQRLHRMEEFPGTGIGLATVQRIMQRHGGKIWAEAEVDQGASFSFSFS